VVALRVPLKILTTEEDCGALSNLTVPFEPGLVVAVFPVSLAVLFGLDNLNFANALKECTEEALIG
jgi:hypothetical protein